MSCAEEEEEEEEDDDDDGAVDEEAPLALPCAAPGDEAPCTDFAAEGESIPSSSVCSSME